MSQSKTDKIWERLEDAKYEVMTGIAGDDRQSLQQTKMAEDEADNLYSALEAVLKELSKQQAHSNRWSDEYREAQELLDIIADELDVEES